MLTLIEVKCPHCGTVGQVMLPPMGTIVVGPCPECQGIVAVFSGKILPLDKEIMVNGSPDDKQEHLMQVLTEFLEDRVTQLVKELTEAQAKQETDETESDLIEEEEAPSPPPSIHRTSPISQDELESFVQGELGLLDDEAQFKAIFG